MITERRTIASSRIRVLLRRSESESLWASGRGNKRSSATVLSCTDKTCLSSADTYRLIFRERNIAWMSRLKCSISRIQGTAVKNHTTDTPALMNRHLHVTGTEQKLVIGGRDDDENVERDDEVEGCRRCGSCAHRRSPIHGGGPIVEDPLSWFLLRSSSREVDMRFPFNFKRPVRNSCSRRRISVCKPANDIRIPVVPDQDGGGLACIRARPT